MTVDIDEGRHRERRVGGCKLIHKTGAREAKADTDEGRQRERRVGGRKSMHKTGAREAMVDIDEGDSEKEGWEAVNRYTKQGQGKRWL